MKKALSCLAVFVFVLGAGYPAIADDDNAVDIKGIAYTVVEPDIAYMNLHVKGTGESYNDSNKAAEDKIQMLRDIMRDATKQKIDVVVLNRRNKIKNKEDDYTQKAFIEGMAKAMKGEEVEDTKEKEKEKQTIVNAYLAFSKLPEKEMIKLQGKLAEKEIAFDENYLFDYLSSLTLENDVIFYGLKKPYDLLEPLSKSAYEDARVHALAIAKGAGKALGEIISISICGSCLVGDSALDEISNKVGKDLGPLSFDPNRLVIKYSSEYKFRLQ